MEWLRGKIEQGTPRHTLFNHFIPCPPWTKWKTYDKCNMSSTEYTHKKIFHSICRNYTQFNFLCLLSGYPTHSINGSSVLALVNSNFEKFVFRARDKVLQFKAVFLAISLGFGLLFSNSSFPHIKLSFSRLLRQKMILWYSWVQTISFIQNVALHLHPSCISNLFIVNQEVQ